MLWMSHIVQILERISNISADGYSLFNCNKKKMDLSILKYYQMTKKKEKEKCTWKFYFIKK